MSAAPDARRPGTLRTALPMVLGFLPVGVAFGYAAVAAHVHADAAMGLSALVFAGTSQFLYIAMAGAGAPAGAIWLATLAVNARHVLYGPALRPHLRGWRERDRVLFAALLTDEAFALLGAMDASAKPLSPAFALGVAVLGYLAWNVGSAAGLMAGSVLLAAAPLVAGAAAALPGMFAGLLAPRLLRPGGILPALAGAAAAIAACALHMGGASVVIGVAAGAAVGAVAGGGPLPPPEGEGP